MPDVLTLRDACSRNYIAVSGIRGALPPAPPRPPPGTDGREKIYDAVLGGDREGIALLVDGAVGGNMDAPGIVDLYLIPAIS